MRSVRISRCIPLVLAGVALAAAGCGAAGRADPGSAAGTRASERMAARTVAGLSCRATTTRGTELLPAAFRPVAVVRCLEEARGIPGRGLWGFEVKQRADRSLGGFVASLRRPSVRTPPSVICPAVLYAAPSFVLVDGHGRVVRPALPVRACGVPFAAPIRALEKLPWVTVSVRRTGQLATHAELVAGCAPRSKDVIRIYSRSSPGFLRPSAGGPVFAPRPPRLRICVYQDGSDRFIRGGLIGQAAESKLLAGIQGARRSARCMLPHARYAVLLAVSPASRGGQIANAELGGCDRILHPDGQVGTISRAARAIIASAGRS
jgi:hypothetical protein